MRFPDLAAAFVTKVTWLTLGVVVAGSLQAQDDIVEPELPEDSLAEPLSQGELLPSLVEPGLSPRAVPAIEPKPVPAEEEFEPLVRLTKPIYQDLRAPPTPSALPPVEPSRFRPVISYEPDLGLHPRIYRPGPLEVYLSFGLAQSFDSNVNLTASGAVADLFVTPRAAVELQLGTPDSIRTLEYDTILALNIKAEAYADIFYENPEYSAFNYGFEANGRIGRDAAIWRPFLTFSDLTGSSLLITEFTNRIRRLRMLSGLTSQYQFTELLGFNQTVSYFLFDHPEEELVNFDSWQAQGEVTYRVLHDTEILAWGQYRETYPSQGSSGREVMVGLGWQGRPDPRLYTAAHVGWDFLTLSGDVPGRSDLSGVRFNGYTTFDWSPRTRLTVKYDRDYVFNEIDVDDNYTSTLIQLKAEFYLGANWYVTPYLGVAFLDYEVSRRLLVQSRPEVEVAYAFPQTYFANESRVFVKLGYQNLSVLRGAGEMISDWRVSIGTNWMF